MQYQHLKYSTLRYLYVYTTLLNEFFVQKRSKVGMLVTIATVNIVSGMIVPCWYVVSGSPHGTNKLCLLCNINPSVTTIKHACTYVYICMSIYVCLYIYVYVHVCLCMYVYICMSMYVYVCLYMYVYVCLYMVCACVHMCVCVCVCVGVYIYMLGVLYIYVYCNMDVCI